MGMKTGDQQGESVASARVEFFVYNDRTSQVNDFKQVYEMILCCSVGIGYSATWIMQDRTKNQQRSDALCDLIDGIPRL